VSFPARILVALLLFQIVGCRTAPIRDVVDAPLPAHGTARTEDVDQAIWRASRKLGWQLEIVEPGHLRGTLRVRRHAATVSITHDGERFSIRHESSDKLLEDGDRIHENYNEWIRKLAAKIQAEPVLLTPF